MCTNIMWVHTPHFAHAKTTSAYLAWPDMQLPNTTITWTGWKRVHILADWRSKTHKGRHQPEVYQFLGLSCRLNVSAVISGALADGSAESIV